MSQTVSLRMSDDMVDRLDRFARRLGNGMSRSRVSVLLLDEMLRINELTGIEYRNTSIGRQPFVKNTGMAVWEIIMVAERFELSATRTADHLQIPTDAVQSALNYYADYPNEIDQAISDNDGGEERLVRHLPAIQMISVERLVMALRDK